ncbi:MAG: cupin domain-containing protein [Nanoarchaeota archaeon]
MKHKYNLKDSISYPDGGVISKVIVKSERLNVTLFSMAAGTEIGEHTSTKEGTVYVIEGDGVFTLANESIVMKASVLIHMIANQPHSIAANKNTSFLLTLIG